MSEKIELEETVGVEETVGTEETQAKPSSKVWPVVVIAAVILIVVIVVAVLLVRKYQLAANPAETQGTGEQTGTVADSEIEFSVSDKDYSDYVALPDYTVIKLESPVVTEEAVQVMVDEALNAIAETKTVTDRPVQNGDVVNIDFEGKKDGVAFEGGTAQGMDLAIGSGQFIDGFESGLVGREAGETVDLDLTFPKDYGNTDLAGVAVVFTVTVNSITETIVPELTDEIVPQLNPDYTTVADYKQFLYDSKAVQLKELYTNEKGTMAVDKVYQESTFQDPPADLLDWYTKEIEEYYDLSIEAYMEAYGVDRETLIQTFFGDEAGMEALQAQEVVTSAKQEILVRAIAKKEGITVTETELRAFAKEQMELNGIGTLGEYVEAAGGADVVELQWLNKKVMEALGEYAVFVE